MVDFGSLAQNAAKQFNGGGSGGEEPKKENKEQSSGDQWADVGSSAKKAYSGYQQDHKPDYKEASGVAQKAYSAYSSNDGPKDTTSIGKSVAQGFFGKSGDESKPEEKK